MMLALIPLPSGASATAVFVFCYTIAYMRGFLFIDGSNFYFKLKQLSGGVGYNVNLLEFDYKAFAQWLVAPHELAGGRYYIGAVKQDGTEKSRRMYADQQRLFRK